MSRRRGIRTTAALRKRRRPDWGLRADPRLLAQDPILQQLVEALRAYGAERIILFGSRARGEAHEWSDYDLIVVKRTRRRYLDRLREVDAYLKAIPRHVDIFVYTPSEFRHMMEERPLGVLLRQEGVLLYEASR